MLAALLCLSLLINPTLAGPRSSSVIRAKLFHSIPTCATSCLDSFVDTSFPRSVCSNGESLQCLCTHRGLSGFTLGEGALECVVSDCSSASSIDYINAYEICSNIPGAVPATHGTLSASMESPSTILLDPTPAASSAAITSPPSSGLISSMTALVTDTPDPLHTSSFSIRFSGTLEPSASLTSSAKVSPGTAAVASSSASPAPVLNKAQIIGISVAGGVIFLVAVCLLFFVFCFRRRRGDRRHSGSSFGGDEVIGGFSPVRQKQPEFLSPISPISRPGYALAPKAQQILGTDTNRWSRWRRQPPRPQDIGLAITPRLDQGFVSDVSPISVQSYQTTSRLLPDKPSYSASQALSPNDVPRRPMRFADGVGLRVVNPTPPTPPSSKSKKSSPQLSKESPDSLGSGPIINRQPSDPFLHPLIEDPSEKPVAVGRRRASRLDLPRLETSAPTGSLNSWSQKRRPDVPLPQPTYNPADYSRLVKTAAQPEIWKPAIQLAPAPTSRRSQENRANYPSQQPYAQAPFQQRQPQYLAYQPPQPQPHSERQPPRGGEAEASFNKYVPVKPLHSSAQRPLTYLTSGSDTSFESDAEPDEPLPIFPTPGHTSGRLLSPVAESPRGPSTGPALPTFTLTSASAPINKSNGIPLSQIRYPVIPRNLSSKKTLRVSPAKGPTQASPTTTTNPNPSPSPGTTIVASISSPSPNPSIATTPPQLRRKPKNDAMHDFRLPAWDTLPPRERNELTPRSGFDSDVDASVSGSNLGLGPFELPERRSISPAKDRGVDTGMNRVDAERARGERLVAQRAMGPSAGASPGGSPDANERIRGTATWRVLCEPGEREQQQQQQQRRRQQDRGYGYGYGYADGYRDDGFHYLDDYRYGEGR